MPETVASTGHDVLAEEREVMKERDTDLVIVGGGLGGVAAALAAMRLGKRAILTEESDWIGGQLTAQAVPPDEHAWIEGTGCTATYRQLREGIRNYYRCFYPLLPEAHNTARLNPGMGWVSPLCHEPRVALAVLQEMLARYRAGGQLEILLRHRPVAVETDGDTIKAVVVASLETGDKVTIAAPYILDATELGDVLALGNVEHVTGAESQSQTGEPHAITGDPDPLDQQAISWCFALDYLPGEDHSIDKPADYDFWQSYQADFWPDRQLSWTFPDPITLLPVTQPIFDGPPQRESADDLWHYRRILYSQYYPEGVYSSDITLVNWPQTDYWLGPLIGVGEEEQRRHLRGAKQLSLSMLYWMQTEAPRRDGGYGYPGLRLRADVVGTEDGLALYPYVRESRRIQAEFTVLEQHVGVEARSELEGAEVFEDSVGIGSYRIDLHPSTRGRTYIDISSWPFQIPLGSLLPVRVNNLLPAAKNLGVTHITNGCYRLHPVEWNIGEAAGALAAYCLEKRVTPRAIRHTSSHLAAFQGVLTDLLGFELAWPRFTPR